MPLYEPEELLKSAHFLRDVEEDALHRLERTLVRETYDQGETILNQGTRATAMYFIANGGVDILQITPNQPERLLATLDPGDTFGEIEMVFRQSRIATVRTNQPTIVYRWDREAMSRFMKSHPAALTSLRFAANSRRFAQRLRFSWLTEDEAVYGLARKHIVLLYEGLTLPLFLLIAGVALIAYGLVRGGEVFLWGAGGFLLVGFAFGIWRWVDWGNDYYILTDRRAVWLEKVVGIYDSRIEAPLHMVLSVSATTDFLGRLFGYGDVIIRTYTGQVVFRNIENPKAMAAMVEEHWERVRAKKDVSDRESLEEIMTHRLEPTDESTTIEPPEDSAPDESVTPARPSGLGRFGFKIRFEEKGIITYRKHWAVLIREIGIPSISILLLVGLIGARLGGLVGIGTVGNFLLISTLILIPLLLWWLYRYVDWANDIYQITADQIVDVYKQPLAREVRKVAPLENILGTEVDRKGILGIMLNYGDVITNIGTAQFTFQGIYDPVGVQQEIVHAQEAFLQRVTERERRQRRDEMVELLDIYHERYQGRRPRSDKA